MSEILEEKGPEENPALTDGGDTLMSAAFPNSSLTSESKFTDDPPLLSLREAALCYARNGWRIFPLLPGEKRPVPEMTKWQERATCDIATVTNWWNDQPAANIGLVLDGLLVLDVDAAHGGHESLAKLEAEHEPLDRRAYQRSGSGGFHFLFRAVEGISTKLNSKTGLELLTGLGHYICVAPTFNAENGGRYEWLNVPHPLRDERVTIHLLPPPQWLIDVLCPAAKKKGRPMPNVRPENRVPIERLLEDAIQQARDGAGRNNAGLWLFTQLRDNGYSRDEALQVKRAWVKEANRESHGQGRYTLGEADATLKQAYRREPRAPWPQPDTGLVQEIEKAIKAEHHFARDEGDMLYHFEDGVYRPKGEKFIRRAVKEYCEQNAKTKSWSPELADKVVKYIIVDAPELWERPPLDTLNVRNGLFDVRTRAVRPHSPEFLSPVQIEASYDPSAKCPAIERFVSETFPEDAQHMPYEIAAWLMLPDTSIQKAVLAVGEGSNGKSVFLTLLEDFLGKENVSSVALHKIEADKFAAARLVGKLANICADLPTAALSGTSMFKALTGGDFINAERKFQSSFEFRPYARLVFSANTLPRSDDATHGFFRRWLVVPFAKTFAETDPGWVPHPVLKARLRAELPGLLNRALAALGRVQAGSFTETASLKSAWDQFRRTTDPLAVWLEANTVDAPEAFIPKIRLRELYASDCRDNGRPILPEAVFTERLRRLKPRVSTGQRTAKRIWSFVGIGLRTNDYEQVRDGELLAF